MCHVTCKDDRFVEDVTKLEAVYCDKGEFKFKDNNDTDEDYLSKLCVGCPEFKSLDSNYNWDCGIIKRHVGFPQEWCHLQCVINETLSPNISIVCNDGNWFNSNVSEI